MKLFHPAEFFSRSLARKAILVVLLSCVPSLYAVVVASANRHKEELERIARQAKSSVHTVAEIQRTVAFEAETLLATIAQVAVHTSQQGNLSAFFSRLDAFHFAYADFFLVDDKGFVVAAKGGSGSGQVQVSDRMHYAKSQQKNTFVAGEVAFSRQTGVPILHYGYRLANAGDRKYLLGVGVNLHAYDQMMKNVSVPTGARLYVADVRGRIAFAKPPLQRNLLPSVPARVARAVLEQPASHGVLYLPAKDGRTLVAYEHISLPNGKEPYLVAILTLHEDTLASNVQDVLQEDILLVGSIFFAMIAASSCAALLLISPSVVRLLEGAKEVMEGKERRLDFVRCAPHELQTLVLCFNELAATKELKDQSVRTARHLVEKAAMAKTQFLANMSHEIRTPMNAIIGMAYLTLQEPLAIYQKEYLRNIHTSGQALLQVVNDILELSKLDTGQSENEHVGFSFRDLFIEIRHRFSAFAAEKGISLILSVAPNVPHQVEGNPLRLSQVIGHLVDNAIRYSPRGVVEIACVSEATTENAVILNISVKDHGRGLTPSKRIAIQRMLDEQNPNLCESAFGDTGALGLLLAQRMLLLMGGRLSVVSEVNMGSVFTVHVPLRTRPLEVTGRYVDSLRGMRVLAVDDDDVSLGVLSSLLREFGMRVDITMAPEDAVQYIEHADRTGDPYRFILLDWKMPDYDGLELCAEIKQRLTLTSHPSIILVSAFGAGLPEVTKQKAGVDSFLHKPINPSVLFDTIIHLLQAQTSPSVLSPQCDFTWLHNQVEGLSILLAEDNPINQQIAIDFLGEAGVRLTVANNGEEALQHFLSLPTEAPFDIILTDMQMPKLSGYEMSRRIRRLAMPWALDIPIIAMTAHSRNSELGDFTASGLSDYVGKPIVVEDLFKALQRWLPVTTMIDNNVCAAAQDLYVLCAQRQLLPALALLREISGLLEPSFREGRVKRLREMMLNGRFDQATAFLERLDLRAQFMQRGKK